jgi:hypothetical protein
VEKEENIFGIIVNTEIDIFFAAHSLDKFLMLKWEFTGYTCY